MISLLIYQKCKQKAECENIGWRYINNHSDAQRQYISATKLLIDTVNLKIQD